MAILAAGTRILVYGREQTDISYTTTPGSPARFDTTVPNPPGSAEIPATRTSLIPLGGSFGKTYVSMKFFVGSTYGIGPELFTWLSPALVTVASFGRPSGNFRFRSLNAAGSFVDRGNTAAPPTSALNLVEVEYAQTPTPFVKVWVNGVPVIDVTWTDETALRVAFLRVGSVISVGNMAASELLVTDGDRLAGYGVGSQVLTGTGLYNDGTGTVVQTGDLDFATGKTLTAVNQKFTGTKPTYTLPADTAMNGVVVNTLIRGSPGIPNARIYARDGASEGATPDIAPAPDAIFGVRSEHVVTNPATGTAFTQANYNSAELGIEARA